GAETAIAVLVEFDQGDGRAEQHAGGQQGGDHGRRQAGRSEQRQAERDAHVAGIGVGSRQAFDAQVGKGAVAPARQGDGGERDCDAAGAGGGEAPVQRGGIGLRHGAKQQRGQRQVDYVSVERVGGGRAQYPAAGGQPARQDEGEDRQGGGGDGLHETTGIGRGAHSTRPEGA